MEEITIKIDKNIADAISKLNGRYYFGLFESITLNSNEEFEFRDAVAELSKLISYERSKEK